jgi:tRNA isopentenyl-2-thiomethyl-A-37 hydroxylase MiaE
LEAAREHFEKGVVAAELKRFAMVEAEVIRELPFGYLMHSGPPRTN